MATAHVPRTSPLHLQVREALEREIEATMCRLTEDRVGAIVDEVLDRSAHDGDTSSPASQFEGFVNSVTIEGVRSFGPPETFCLSRGLTLVFGPNGVGKTSITDALELFEHGETSRQLRGGQETSDKTHVPHLRSDGERGAAPHVVLTWCTSRDADDVQTQRWEWGDPGHLSREVPLAIVARRTIRQPFDAKAGERIEQLGRAAGLETVAEWSAAANELPKMATEHAPLTQSLESFVPDLLRDVDKDATLLDVEALTGHIRRSYVETARRKHPSFGALPEAPATPEAPEPHHLRELAEKVSDAKERIQAIPQSDAADLVPLMLKYLEVAQVEETCPTCADGTFTASRRQEIDDLLALHTARRKAEEHLAGARGRLTGEATSLLGRLGCATVAPHLADGVEHDDALVMAWTEVVRTHTEWTSAQDDARSALGRVRQEPGDAVAARRAVETIDALAQIAEECGDAARAWQEAEVSFRTTEQHEHDDVARRARIIDGREDELARAVLERRRADLLAKTIKKAVAHLKSRTTAHFDAEIDVLESSIREWTTILSPPDTPAVELRATPPRGRGTSPTLTYSAGSEDHHVSGRYSDSQLETLGMAIRLARAEREQPGGLVVLDDPSDVLDEDTTRQLVTDGLDRLLTRGHQVLVLTHDRALTRAVWARIGDFADPVEHHLVETARHGEDRVARFAARDLAGILARLEEVLDDGQDRHGPFDDWQTWRVNAAGNLLRQAIEATLAEVEQVFDSVISGRPAAWKDADSLTRRWERMREDLEKRHSELERCESGRCRTGLGDLNTLMNQVADIYSMGINEASHPDVVLPTLRAVRLRKAALAKVASLLRPSSGVHADRHLTCKAAVALSHAAGCAGGPGIDTGSLAEAS
ncbi:AAA family ATPase [Isoptericola sp. NPDC056578]|uniref:AAA family ATPase n=1 Tax=Isoptericola sp. NPDC056578 TaxID=3345870 RepID=UPI0036CE739B